MAPCGDSETNACKTIEFAVSSLKENERLLVDVGAGQFAGTALETTGVFVSVRGAGVHATNISTTGFTLNNNASLSLSQLTINNCDNAVSVADAGDVRLSNVVVENNEIGIGTQTAFENAVLVSKTVFRANHGGNSIRFVSPKGSLYIADSLFTDHEPNPAQAPDGVAISFNGKEFELVGTVVQNSYSAHNETRAKVMFFSYFIDVVFFIFVKIFGRAW